jgi:F-type H+-transporting ATPase subunit a
MASAVLHIKDGYFFEVPKALWPCHYTDLSQVPQFLVKAHPHESLAEFNSQLSGKILIPQPFAKLKSLYHTESGFGISKFMILELLAALIIAVIFIRVSRKIETGEAPKGRWWNLCEVFLVFIRDQIARPAIGGHDADRFVPLLWTFFFFILTCNLLGLIPWLGAPTGAFATTLGLAGIVFGTTLAAGMLRFGPIGFWVNQVPHMDLPIWLSPLKLMIFVIEVIGLVIKHIVLGVRLLANMVAGHLVLLGIMGLIVASAASATSTWTVVTVISVLGSTAFSLLELFVAFLQAYIFTFLSALFIGAAIHHH